MPFKSEKQRRYLWMHEPKLAKRWAEEYGSRPKERVKVRYKGKKKHA